MVRICDQPCNNKVNNTVIFLVIPGQPSKPEASEITTDSVTLEFDLQFMGTGIVKHFVLRVMGDSEETQNIPADDRINSSSNVTVTVVGLAADSTYRFQVAAMNDIDIGPYSEMSDEVTTGKEINCYLPKLQLVTIARDFCCVGRPCVN